jgi:hypothetical protein
MESYFLEKIMKYYQSNKSRFCLDNEQEKREIEKRK